MSIALPAIPDRVEIEKNLGETFQLDGSFASLWAVETLLNIIRKKPEWQHQLDWVPQYIYSILCRAFNEMGLEPDTSLPGVINIGAGQYVQNVYADFKKLMNPPVPFPTVFPNHWSNAPVMHLAALPWYALAVIFKGQEWASTKLEPIENRAEDRERGVNWLCREYLSSELGQSEELTAVAKKILSAMFSPLLIAEQNHFGELSLPQLQNIFNNETVPDHFVNAIIRLITSQDLSISILAGATCFMINIAPTSPLEARCVKRCVQYYKTLPMPLNGESSERVLEVVKMLSASSETPLVATSDLAYLDCIKLANEHKYDLACERLTSLINQNQDNPLFYRARGRILERLGRDQYAFDDYNKALSLKSDYWQALINRASYFARQRKYDQAHHDFQCALKIRPDCEVTRDNLLSTYFLAKTA